MLKLVNILPWLNCEFNENTQITYELKLLEPAEGESG